jgi:hypothetical protein
MGIAAALRSVCLAAAVSGCDLVLGIDDRSPATECPDAPPPASYVRVGNLAPHASPIAFCLSPAGGEPLRVPRGLPGCPAALGYPQIAAPAELEPGIYDVRVIDGGSSCDGASIIETAAVELGPATTLVALGPPGAMQLERFADSAPPAPAQTKMRFVHAALGVPHLDAGLGNSSGLPAQLTDRIFMQVPFGESSAGHSDPGYERVVDENGYVPSNTPDWLLAVTEAGAKAALVASALTASEDLGMSVTLYAVGIRDDPTAALEPLLCRDYASAGGLTSCASGPAASLSVETLALSLGALNFPHGDQRTAAVAPVLRDAGADVICLEEAWPKGARDGIVEALKDRYPHVLRYDHGHDARFGDARDLDGTVPEQPSEPPCAGAPEAAFQVAVDCLEANCSTSPGNPDARLADAACGSSACFAEFGDLLTADGEDQRCASCALVTLGSTATFADARRDCTTVTSPFAFGGESGTLLLSRAPWIDAESHVVPSTWFRHEILRGRLRLDNGLTPNIYCAYATGVPNFDYNGVYGAGATNADGWRNERRLFVKNLANLVAQRSGAGKAVILGSFYTGPEVRDASGSVIIEGNEPERFAELVHDFQLLVPQGFQPRCTVCSDNPLGVNPRDIWTDHLFGHRLRDSDVVSLTRVYDSASVDIGGALVPLSLHYGLRAQLSLRP